jgi:hypothetical protein
MISSPHTIAPVPGERLAQPPNFPGIDPIAQALASPRGVYEGQGGYFVDMQVGQGVGHFSIIRATEGADDTPSGFRVYRVNAASPERPVPTAHISVGKQVLGVDASVTDREPIGQRPGRRYYGNHVPAEDATVHILSSGDVLAIGAPFASHDGRNYKEQRGGISKLVSGEQDGMLHIPRHVTTLNELRVLLHTAAQYMGFDGSNAHQFDQLVIAVDQAERAITEQELAAAQQELATLRALQATATAATIEPPAQTGKANGSGTLLSWLRFPKS